MKSIAQVFPLDNSPGYIINKLARELNACLYRSFRNNGYEITANFEKDDCNILDNFTSEFDFLGLDKESHH